MVSTQGKQRYMGDEAAAIMKSNFKNTPMNIKRLIGRKFSEPEVRDLPVHLVLSKRLKPSAVLQMKEEMARTPGLTFTELENGNIGVEVQYNDETVTLSMEQCVAMMLTKLCKITMRATDAKPGDCVVSIPAYYTDSQRASMLQACDIAQLHCLRLLHEGTAVALEYGMFKSAKGQFDAAKPSPVMFLDFGQSSFTVTIAAFTTGKLVIKASECDRSLGGRDFDEVRDFDWILFV